MVSNLISPQPAIHPLHCYHPGQPLRQPFAPSGSHVISGPFGTVLYRQIDGYYNIYRHYHCFIREAGQVPCFVKVDRPFFCMSMRNTITLQFDDGTYHSFFEWGCNIVYHPAGSASAVFHSSGEYSFLIIHLDPFFLDQFSINYPMIDPFLQSVGEKRITLFNGHNFPASRPTRDAVSSVLYYNYAERYFYIYLVAKCQELLLPFLKQSEKICCMGIALNEKEAEAIYHIRERLQAQMHQPHVLEDLVLFSGLSEYKLKNGFRQIYGLGIFEFLYEARMKKAYELVADTLTPYDAIAVATGYQSTTTFFNQFKKYVGFSPKRLRDSIQGNGARFRNRRK